MSPARPLPEFWYPIARVLLVLKALLAATEPGRFAAIAAHVHRELVYAGAYVRRYLLALAQDLVLAPLRVRAPSVRSGTRVRRRPLDRPLSLAEPPARKRPPGRPRGPPSSPYVEWALALQRTETLLAALRSPLPIARRLARRLARGAPPVLREAAVPWHVLRALPPALDCLLTRLDCLARPALWSGIDPDPG
jgi:hypothetical protein